MLVDDTLQRCEVGFLEEAGLGLVVWILGPINSSCSSRFTGAQIGSTSMLGEKT